MSGPLIIIVGIIYLFVGIDLIIKGQVGLGIAFLAYAIANVGLFMATLV
jgi:hypothetical protein